MIGKTIPITMGRDASMRQSVARAGGSGLVDVAIVAGRLPLDAGGPGIVAEPSARQQERVHDKGETRETRTLTVPHVLDTHTAAGAPPPTLAVWLRGAASGRYVVCSRRHRVAVAVKDPDGGEGRQPSPFSPPARVRADADHRRPRRPRRRRPRVTPIEIIAAAHVTTALLVGVVHAGLILAGLRAMRRASDSRDQATAIQVRAADQCPEATMRALDALIAGQRDLGEVLRDHGAAHRDRGDALREQGGALREQGGALREQGAAFAALVARTAPSSGETPKRTVHTPRGRLLLRFPFEQQGGDLAVALPCGPVQGLFTL